MNEPVKFKHNRIKSVSGKNWLLQTERFRTTFEKQSRETQTWLCHVTSTGVKHGHLRKPTKHLQISENGLLRFMVDS